MPPTPPHTIPTTTVRAQICEQPSDVFLGETPGSQIQSQRECGHIEPGLGRGVPLGPEVLAVWSGQGPLVAAGIGWMRVSVPVLRKAKNENGVIFFCYGVGSWCPLQGACALETLSRFQAVWVP